MSLKVLILGVNGFIGSNLSTHILAERDWEIYGMDIGRGKIRDLLDNPRFHYVEGDININKEWIEYHIKKCDVVLPLVAIATPATYVTDPLAVFELDFEANLEIVRHCVKYKKRILFPSTSEVYGMSTDSPYDEESSNLVTGPIHKERWIYSCSKQLLDRVIYAYGSRGALPFTLFRPFNWFGPGLDNVWEPKEGSSRVITQFLSAIFHSRDITLVNGGEQKRCFLYIDDAIEALIRIIENKDGLADGRIINIGSPYNESSIKELAETMIEIVEEFSGYENIRNQTKVNVVGGKEFYGAGYQDLVSRVPLIDNAKSLLGWEPSTDLKSGLRQMIDFYVQSKSEADVL
ncbi:MAG: bifunctional UDP-4-keto-pentose/UDP-xylose synthase [Sneathiella sp.]|nr:bifunctional UDP-4-keto-pentose/UDP-xylose synthase [Sneathiella sp.]